MSLTEGLVASVVFTAAASASMQIWALTAVGTVAHDRRQERLERVDATLMAVEAALRREASPAAAGAGCAAVVEHLAATLAASPLEADVERHVQQPGDGTLVVRVTAAGVSSPRQRLYSPAALNLCGAPAPIAREGNDASV